MIRQSLIAVVLALLSCGLSAATNEVVDRAFAAIDSREDVWAFTQTTTNGRSVTIERFDPSRPEAARWELVSKDGKAPSAADIEAYREEKAKQHRRLERDSGEKTTGDMVDRGTLQLVRETSSELVYSFRPSPPTGETDGFGKEMTDAMRGMLVIDKSGPYVASMELKNERPISPGMSVKIETMFTKMTFAPGDGQPVLIREIDAMVRGRMFLLKRIDETTKIRFTDYRRVERR